MRTQGEPGEVALPEQDEVTGRVADWVGRVWTGAFRAEWAVAWYAFLLTALTALVVKLVSAMPMWLMPPRVDEAEFRFPIGRWLLHTFLDAPWHGAFLGLGLVVLDRVAGKWRRPVRWAVAGVLFPGLLALLVPQPTEWRYVYVAASATGLLQAVNLIHPWQSWLWLLLSAACSGAWGWWVGRALTDPGRPHGRLARAGMEAALVVYLLAGLVGLPRVLPMLREQTMSWTELWANSAFGLVSTGFKGALNGVAIAVALQATRPREPEDEARGVPPTA